MRKPKSGSQKLVEIARARQPHRPHFLELWANRSGYRDRGSLTNLARDLDADKSLVSRWYEGATPNKTYQLKLAALFGHPGDSNLIFVRPDDYWMQRFLEGRDEAEMQRIKQSLELHFPRKS